MTNEINKLDNVAVKIEQVKTLMGVLIQYNDIPKTFQDNIIHIAFDILAEQEKSLTEIFLLNSNTG